MLFFYGPLYLESLVHAVCTGLLPFGEMTPGMVSVCCTPWFDSGYMLGVSLRGLFCLPHCRKTAESPQLQFFDGRRHSLRYAEAVSHGPACLADQEISQLQFTLGGRCPWSAVVQVPVPQLQFIVVVVYTPVVAQNLSHGPDSSLDLGVPGGRRPSLQVEQVHFPVVTQRQVPWSKLFV